MSGMRDPPVVELKAQLRSQGLPVSGLKAELRARLAAAAAAPLASATATGKRGRAMARAPQPRFTLGARQRPMLLRLPRRFGPAVGARDCARSPPPHPARLPATKSCAQRERRV